MQKTIASIGTLGALNYGAVNMVPMYFMNVPSSTVFMAFVGAALTAAWSDEKYDSKKKLYISVLFFTLLSTTLVAVLPSLLGWEWYSVRLEGSMAFLMSVVAPTLIPIFKNLLPELARKWFRLEDKKPEEKQDENL